MKKYLLIATVAFTAISCMDNSSVIKNDLTGDVIGFTSYATPTTKAAENSNADYDWQLKDHHTNFYVYGYKTVGSDITKVFDKQEVKWDNPDITPDGWNYTPARYWDKAASNYYFYAAAPIDTKWDLKANTAARDDDYFTYAGYSLQDHDATVAADPANSVTGNEYVSSFNDCRNKAVDLMIADKCPWAASEIGKKVNLNFIHILSRLNVIIKRGEKLDPNDVVTLKDFKVFNFYAGGDFSEATAAVATGTTGRWDNYSGSVNYTALSEANVVVLSGTPKQYILQSLVVPQEIEYDVVKVDGTDIANFSAPKAYFYVEYEISNSSWTGNPTENYKGYYNLAAAFGATVSDGNADNGDESKVAFNEGWQNNLTLKINPDKIEFDVTKVALWGDVNVDVTPAGDIH